MPASAVRQHQVRASWEDFFIFLFILFSGTPSPTLSWYKETAHGSEDMKDHVTVTDNKAVLQLSKVSRHHAGHYVCSASNGYLPVIKAARLGVQRAAAAKCWVNLAPSKHSL